MVRVGVGVGVRVKVFVLAPVGVRVRVGVMTVPTGVGVFAAVMEQPGLPTLKCWRNIQVSPEAMPPVTDKKSLTPQIQGTVTPELGST